MSFAEWKYWMKLSVYFSVVFCLFVACQSQSQTAKIQKFDSLSAYQFPLFQKLDTNLKTSYPFIQFQRNNFQFFTETSPNWEMLFQDLSNLEHTHSCKLNFYHIGGSHLQADVYSHDIRTYLQTKWPGVPGERGMIFPFDLAHTNNPWNYEFKSYNNWRSYRSVSFNRPQHIDFGLLGAVIETNDSIVELSFHYDKTDVKPGFTRIRIYHNKGFFPYELNFGGDEILLVNEFRNETIGFTEAVFTDPIDTFNLQFVKLIDEPFALQLQGFQLSNSLPGISYSAIGINGAGLYTYLANANFEEQLKELPPDLFVFSVGTNDANVPYESFKPEVYKQNLDKMIQHVLAANPDCALLLTVPNDAGYHRKYLNRNVAREREVIIELAKKYKCPVWDFYGIMGELGSSRTWKYHGLMKSDLIHFTALGYHLKGALFIDAFEKWLYQMSNRKTIN